MLLLEPSIEGCINAAKRGVENIVNGYFDRSYNLYGNVNQFIMLDVLEHIEDDYDMVKNIYDGLHDGGKAIFTVPAFTCLWSSEDGAAGHYRRYKLKEIEQLIKKAGFKIIYSSYFFGFLFLPIYIFRHWFEKFGFVKKYNERSKAEDMKLKEKEFGKQNIIVRFVLKILEKIETSIIIAGKKLIFGSSIVVICEKNEKL